MRFRNLYMGGLVVALAFASTAALAQAVDAAPPTDLQPAFLALLASFGLTGTIASIISGLLVTLFGGLGSWILVQLGRFLGKRGQETGLAVYNAGIEWVIGRLVERHAATGAPVATDPAEVDAAINAMKIALPHAASKANNPGDNQEIARDVISAIGSKIAAGHPFAGALLGLGINLVTARLAKKKNPPPIAAAP